MKKMKILFWLIIIGFVGLIVFQNQTFFMNPQSIQLDIFITDVYHTPPLAIAIWFLVCFVIGVLGTYFFRLRERFRTKKHIKGLQSTIDGHLDMIAQLRKELESLQPNSVEPEVEQAAMETVPVTEKEAPQA